MNKTIKIIKLVSVDQEPAKMKYTVLWMLAGTHNLYISSHSWMWWHKSVMGPTPNKCYEAHSSLKKKKKKSLWKEGA